MNIIETDNGVSFAVRVIPRSSKSEVIGEHDDALKVKLASPPVDGAANAELVKILAKELGVAKSSVMIVSGESSKTKQLRIDGVKAADIEALTGG